jgi:N-acetyl-anhydromuramyl-L-alanine amidase AmpD
MTHRDTSLTLPSSQYYPAAQAKSLIVLHHTVGGSAKSTFNYWNENPEHIGTAFIVERDGTIFQCFPEDAWAFHLGLKRTHEVDKRSIGIELASEGLLTKNGSELYCFDRISERTKFAGKVYDHGAEWRTGARYFAAYTPEQIDSTIQLVDELLTKFSIPRCVPMNACAYEEKYKAFKGVIGHAHVRPDKTDVHPGFAWHEMAERCKLMPVTFNSY